jgi:hypothetical protein
MSILSGLFKKKTDAPEVSFETFAYFPLHQLVNEQPPFNDWKDPKTPVPEKLEEYFKVCVWMYQMYVYYILTARRFDYEIADRAVRLQAEKLQELSPELAHQLELAFIDIHSTLESQATEPETVEVKGEEIEVPVEYRLSVQFLTEGEGCPFPVSDAVPAFSDADFQLANCLEHGREAARAYFEPAVASTKVML